MGGEVALELGERRVADADAIAREGVAEPRDDEYELLIPLGGADYINLTRAFFCKVHPTIVMSFIDVLRTHFSPGGAALTAASQPGKGSSRPRVASIAG